MRKESSTNSLLIHFPFKVLCSLFTTTYAIVFIPFFNSVAFSITNKKRLKCYWIYLNTYQLQIYFQFSCVFLLFVHWIYPYLVKITQFYVLSFFRFGNRAAYMLLCVVYFRCTHFNIVFTQQETANECMAWVFCTQRERNVWPFVRCKKPNRSLNWWWSDFHQTNNYKKHH